MNLQQRYDLQSRRDEIADELEKGIRPLPPRAA
jgi:hypothetical protein